MQNLLEYIIKIKDMATGPVAKFGEVVSKTFSKIEADEKKFMATNAMAGKSFDSLGRSIDALKAKAHGIEIISNADIAKVRAMNSEIKRLEGLQSKIGSMNGSKLKGWASDAMSQIPGAGLITNPLVAGGAALAGIIKKGADQETQKVKFETMMGKDKGDKMFADMQQFAVKTTFQQSDVIQAGGVLKSMTVNDDKILPIISKLADIAAESPEKLKSLALVYGQVKSKGHADGGDMKQFTEMGFNPNQVLGKASDAKVSVEDLDKALLIATSTGGQFYNMQKNLSEAFGGKLSNLIDAFIVSISNLGEKILPIATIALDAINGALAFILENGDVIAGIIGVVGASMLLAGGGATGLAIGMELASIATNIASSAVYKFAVALLTTPIGWIALAIGGVIIMIREWISHFGSAGEAWAAFGKIITSVWEIIKISFGMYINSIVSSFEIMFYTIVGFFDRMGQKAMNIGKCIKEALSGNIDKASEHWNAKETSIYDDKAEAAKTNLINANRMGIYDIGTKLNAIKTVWASGKGVKDKTSNAGAGAGAGAGVAGTSADANKNNVSTKGATDAITGGGTRNMYINLGKFQDSINIYASSVKEGIDNAGEQLEDMLLRVLNSGGAMQN